VDDGSRLTATGVVWQADGVIVTTSHGVERDEELAVELADERETRLAATLVGRDPDTDIAVLRVGATGLPAMHAGRAGRHQGRAPGPGAGRPGTAGLQATVGIVSARQESQTGGVPEYILHTDAVLYPGFSGGALMDMSGRMVGLTNRAFGRGAGVALGTPLVARVVEALLTQGRVQRGYLGVRTQLVGLPSTLRQTLNLPEDRGLLVVGIENNSPAEAGGLLLGDLLLRVNNQPVGDVDALRGQLRSRKAGESVTLGIVRGGARHDLNVTLGVEA
jgi:S1-C subfamily serine protease